MAVLSPQDVIQKPRRPLQGYKKTTKFPDDTSHSEVSNNKENNSFIFVVRNGTTTSSSEAVI